MGDANLGNRLDAAARALDDLAERSGNGKLYVDSDTGRLGVHSPGVFQGVARSVWNFFYGGASREAVVRYIRQLVCCVEKAGGDALVKLQDPYIESNFRAYGVISGPNRVLVVKLWALVENLGSVLPGLVAVAQTYRDDPATGKELANVSAHFANLRDTYDRYLHVHFRDLRVSLLPAGCFDGVGGGKGGDMTDP